mmetsp:Transcript_1558/g.4010  ORF Transcript_1558/g.4010 Transcript_1558/m.4010 type:complete len:205 (-) Transcript_1558:193-807(-)
MSWCPASRALNWIQLPSPAVGSSGLSMSIQVQAHLWQHVKSTVVKVVCAQDEHGTRWSNASRTLWALPSGCILGCPIATYPPLLLLMFLPSSAISIGSCYSIFAELSNRRFIQQHKVAPIVLVGCHIVDLWRTILYAGWHVLAKLSSCSSLLACAHYPIEMWFPPATRAAKLGHLWVTPSARQGGRVCDTRHVWLWVRMISALC